MPSEATPLTRVVPVGPIDAPQSTSTTSRRTTKARKAASTTTKTASRKGTLVLEVQDPDAVAALGEQLSLANELITPETETPATKSTRKRSASSSKSSTTKSSTAKKTTTKAGGTKSAASKTTTKTTTKRSTKAAGSKTQATTSKTTTSRAKKTNEGEASLSIPITTGGDQQQMLEQIQAMGASITQLQDRLAALQPDSTVVVNQTDAPAPPTTIEAPFSSQPAFDHNINETAAPLPNNQNTAIPPQNGPRLPNWAEPELRPHYTLEESARAYEALEALHEQRKLHPPATTEVNDAHRIAEHLRQQPQTMPAEAPIHHAQQHTGSYATAETPSNYRSRRSRHRAARLANMSPASTPQADSVIAAPTGTQLYAQNNATYPTPSPITTNPGRAYHLHQSRSARKQAHQRRRKRWRWDIQQFWRNLNQLGQSLIPVPIQPGAKIIDVVIWILAAIGLRLVIKFLIQLIPLLALPLNLIMAIPAIMAAYLAFCVHNSRSDVIYRLLLITLGLFLGSRM